MNRHVMPEHASRTEPGRPHAETGREARQGFLGRPVLYVLIGGLLLAAAFIVGTQIWSGTEDVTTDPAIGAAPAADVAPAAGAAPEGAAVPPPEALAP